LIDSASAAYPRKLCSANHIKMCSTSIEHLPLYSPTAPTTLELCAVKTSPESESTSAHSKGTAGPITEEASARPKPKSTARAFRTHKHENSLKEKDFCGALFAVLLMIFLFVFAGFGIVNVHELVTHKVSDVAELHAQLIVSLATLSSRPGDVCTGFAKNYTEFVQNNPMIWAEGSS
jgi:hypothetical protein